MNISNALNTFKKPPQQKQSPPPSMYSSRLWINYTNNIKSIRLTSLPFVDAAIKIAAFVVTLPFVTIATVMTLVADGVKYSFNSTLSSLDKLKNKFTKENTKEDILVKTNTNTKKIVISSVVITITAVSLYALHFYGFIFNR